MNRLKCSNLNPPRANPITGGAQAAAGRFQGAVSCSEPRDSPGQHVHLWVSRCQLLERRVSIVGRMSISRHPTGHIDTAGRLQSAGAQLEARGSPGHLARLWASRFGLLMAGQGSWGLMIQEEFDHTLVRLKFLDNVNTRAGSGGRDAGCRTTRRSGS
jgi:hypothetical protein